jgi:hypothetical protein
MSERESRLQYGRITVPVIQRFRDGQRIMDMAAFTKLRSVTRQVVRCFARAAFAAALVATALALPEAALANVTAWDGINRDIGKLLLYVDRASITHEGSTDKAWLLFDFRSPQSMPIGFKRYQSVKDLVAVNCMDRSYARVKEIKFSGPHASGKVVGTHTWSPDERQFEKAVPSTNSQAVVDSVCHAAAPRS